MGRASAHLRVLLTDTGNRNGLCVQGLSQLCLSPHDFQERIELVGGGRQQHTLVGSVRAKRDMECCRSQWGTRGGHPIHRRKRGSMLE
ncbi:hypothetical protein NDU88_000205 [Pleurodeles waltl]|uniref:Uncharacterized protein n=1 Tax=Pleurodeles waltl TaxID=8319 RepID=A0AAV7KSW5_PLEWA|nr:hypothetical protein NDU88_000205 [Pleurodeles waltl]